MVTIKDSSKQFLQTFIQIACLDKDDLAYLTDAPSLVKKPSCDSKRWRPEVINGQTNTKVLENQFLRIFEKILSKENTHPFLYRKELRSLKAFYPELGDKAAPFYWEFKELFLVTVPRYLFVLDLILMPFLAYKLCSYSLGKSAQVIQKGFTNYIPKQMQERIVKVLQVVEEVILSFNTYYYILDRAGPLGRTRSSFPYIFLASSFSAIDIMKKGYFNTLGKQISYYFKSQRDQVNRKALQTMFENAFKNFP